MNERFPAGRRVEYAETFDASADLYHAARPRYPAALLGALQEHADIGPTTAVLEVGAATGIATEQLATRFGHIVALEPGVSLARAAQANLAALENVEIVESSFEDYTPPEWHSFDLVAAATAWHWLDPSVRYERARRHLRPGGTLAFWSALHVGGRDRFFEETRDLYDLVGTPNPSFTGLPKPGELANESADIDGSGGFTTVAVQHFDWEVTYDADGYTNLLRTFSSFLAMTPADQHTLLTEMRRRIDARPDGVVHRHWGAALHVARAI